MKFVMYTYFDKLVRENGFREALKIAKSIGFSGIEFVDGGIFPDKTLTPSLEAAKEYRRILEEEDMIISCYTVCISIYKSSEATEGLKKHAEYAAAMGAPYLHHPLCFESSKGEHAPSYEEVLADVLPRAAEVAKSARDLGVTCIYEDQGEYLNGVEGFGGFFSALKAECDNVGVCGDFGNIHFVDESAPDFIGAFLPEIKNVHVKDYFITPEKDDRQGGWMTTAKGDYIIAAPIGEGSVDFVTGMRLLRDAGYDGYFSIEQLLPFPEEFIADAKNAMKYLSDLFEG